MLEKFYSSEFMYIDNVRKKTSKNHSVFEAKTFHNEWFSGSIRVGKRFTIARYFYLALNKDSISPCEDHTDIWNTETLFLMKYSFL